MKKPITLLLMILVLSISCARADDAPAYNPEYGLKRGMKLTQARRTVLGKGWHPVRFTEQYDGTQIMLLKHGYKEAAGCSMGLTFCTFFYKRSDGSCLKMTTQGEQISGMTVQNWEPVCQEDDR